MQRLQRTPTLIAATLLCALIAGGVLLASGPSRAADEAKPNPAAAQARPALAVTTVAPQRSPVTLRLPANGNVAAWQEASIGAEANGLRLSQVLVNVGDVVKAGQVLATFATETVEADLAQARASLAEAQAAAAEAQANAERARTLSATGALSAQQIQQYATAAQTGQARVEAAQALLRVQQLRLAQTQVKAPDSGVISARIATVGGVVGAGTELFRLVRRGRLEWRAEVASSELPRIQNGMKAEVTAASGAKVTGTVRSIAPTVDPQTRNALVYVDLPANPDVRAGMFARGDFLLGAHDALTVPQSALVVRDGFSAVFELVDGGRVALRRVQTGQRTGDRVEVLDGLAPGATLVERGGAFLNDGDLVRVAPAQKFESKPAPALVGKAPAASK